MKKFKKLAAVTLALAVLISALSISSAAAENDTYSYYCGFEGYTEQIEGISLDGSVASIVTDEVYKDSNALKLTLPEKGITAFELRDVNPFDIVAGKEYEISFAYKTSGNIEVSAGTADAGNVVKTAVATEGVTLMANEEWETFFLTVTPDRSSSDGYVLAFTVYAETAAEVYFDDITVTYESVGPVVLDEIDFGFTEDDFPTLNVFNKTETDDSEEDAEEIIIWDGTVAESFKEGSGTSADPYLISTPQELALAITQSGTTKKTVTAEDGAETTETVNEPYYGSYYKITADIYLNAKDAIDWKNAKGKQSDLRSWYRYYNYDGVVAGEDFAGTLDGDGHTVYGLYFYDGTTIDYNNSNISSGLIPRVSSGAAVTVKNLGIDSAYVRHQYVAGAIVGSCGNAVTVTNCFVGENVKLTGRDAGSIVGNLNQKKGTFTNCYTLASYGLDEGTFRYGLMGYSYHSYVTVKNCYIANGPITKQSNGDYATCYRFYNSYQAIANGTGSTSASRPSIYTNVVVLDKENMQGTDVFLTESKMPYLALNTDGSANSAFTATEGYPVLSVFPFPVDEEETAGPEITYDIWDGTKTAPKDSDGDGVYEITKGSELAYIIVNHGTMITGTDPETGEDITADACSFILTNDIYLNDITKINWTTGEFATDYTPKSWFGNANYFAGTIDGNGYTVHGLFNVNSAINAKEWGVYGVGLVPRVLWDSAVTIKNLGIDHAYFNSDTGVSAFVGCGGTKNATPTTYAEITIDQCFAGKNVTLVGHSVGVFRGAGRGSNTYISNCYSLATLNATGEKGFVAMTWQAPVTIEKSFNANGTLVTSTSNKVTITDSYQTVAGEKTAVTDISNMKGSDVLTSDTKMPLLNSELFSASENTFADYDFYVYLPAGTSFAEDVDATYYNELFIQLDKDLVVSDKTLLQGAYVKFAAEPVESKINLPFELKDYVRFGTKEELFLSDPYYGVKLDFITDNLEKDGDVVKYAFVTDIHYIGGEDVPRALATIRQLENLVSYVNENDDIDFVAIGGDTIQGTQPKATSIGYLKRAFNPFLKCNKPVVIVPGNHDDNSYAYDAKTFDGSKLITDKNWNDTVINTYVNRETPDGNLISVSQDEKVENSKYFYYDIENKKTRVICLDSINFPQTYDENGDLIVAEDGTVGLKIKSETAAVTNYNKYYMAATYWWGYGARQMEWLAEEALQAGDDWDYVFISHMGIDETTNFNGGAEHTFYGKELREIITAYQFKTPYLNEEIGIDADFTKTSGRILSYQYGHVHGQKSLYSSDIDLWEISTSTAQKRNGCFDIMSVSDKAVKRYGIGVEYDQTLVQTEPVALGDVNLDGTVDICDLVKLDNTKKGKDKLSVSADADGDGIISFIFDIIALRTAIIK